VEKRGGASVRRQKQIQSNGVPALNEKGIDTFMLSIKRGRVREAGPVRIKLDSKKNGAG